MEMKANMQLLPAINKIVSNAEEMLKNILGYDVRVRLAYTNAQSNDETIRNLICVEFDVNWDEVCSKSRKYHLVEARHAYFFLAYRFLKKTLAKIGEDCGGRDHTTIVHGIKKVENMIETNDPMAEQIRRIEEIIKEKDSRKVIHSDSE